MLAPKGVNLHYEVELGCIIGKEMRDLDPDDEVGALEGVKGMLIKMPWVFCSPLSLSLTFQ